MALYIARRAIVSFFVLLVSTMLMYALVAFSGNPLEDLLQDSSSNREAKIAARVRLLNLDEPLPLRYWHWLKSATGCVLPGAPCDLGSNLAGQEVTVLLQQAMKSTLTLVSVAVISAIILGVAVGVISALRQYSGFDYAVTFSAFLFYAMPIFWVAVLLKQYLAIAVNDWLADPAFSWPISLGLAFLTGLTAGALLGKNTAQRWIMRTAAFAATLGLLGLLSAQDWYLRPALGPVVIAAAAFGTGVGLTALMAGLQRRGVLYAALSMSALGAIGQFAITPFLGSDLWSNWSTVALLAVATVLTATALGWFFGGLDRGPAIRVAALTGLITGLWIMVDLALRAIPQYSRSVNGRIIPTVGANTPNYTGDFWMRLLDNGLHLILPTISILLISYATYSRYTRASMLDVLNADYVRTARAKGLNERTVITRHAFRNALIPVVTLMAVDFGALLGGAVITEYVFGWKGMGQLFITGLLRVDPNPVMGFFLVTAVAVVIFNLIADIAYAYLDPRIRLS